MELNKKKVLIVDDEVDYCNLLEIYFSMKKYEVQCCNSLKAFASLLDLFKPDILLLDNNLPDGSGWEIAQQIVQQYPNIRLYLISAYTSSKDFNNDKENIKIWEKPISIDILEEVF